MNIKQIKQRRARDEGNYSESNEEASRRQLERHGNDREDLCRV
jgi:hypothetical protein